METGEMERGLLHCGQAVGLIKDIPSVQEIIDNIITQANTALENLAQ